MRPDAARLKGRCLSLRLKRDSASSLGPDHSSRPSATEFLPGVGRLRSRDVIREEEEGGEEEKQAPDSPELAAARTMDPKSASLPDSGWREDIV